MAIRDLHLYATQDAIRSYNYITALQICSNTTLGIIERLVERRDDNIVWEIMDGNLGTSQFTHSVVQRTIGG